MPKVTTTIWINNDTSNPISVEAVIAGEKENGLWCWSVEHVKNIQLIVGEKENVDITSKLKNNSRALSLITSQVSEEIDQIIDALTGSNDENIFVDNELSEKSHA